MISQATWLVGRDYARKRVGCEKTAYWKGIKGGKARLQTLHDPNIKGGSPYIVFEAEKGKLVEERARGKKTGGNLTVKGCEGPVISKGSHDI